jgi:hypothetical protein
MKQHFFFILILAGFVTACSNSNKSVEKTGPQTVLKPFSDSLKKDTFKLVLNGEKLQDMNMVFTITAHNGQQIYNKVFKATDLINNYKASVDLEKERTQVSFIKDEFKLFFDEENFLEPAVTENESPDQYTPDTAFYNELKKSGLNGFKYRSGKETSVYIAWSEQEKKVQPYYKCCN